MSTVIFKKVDDILSEFFNEIIYTDTNPAVIVKQETFKNKGILETIKTEELYKLESYKIDNTSNIIDDIIYNVIRSNSGVDIKIYKNDIVNRLFNLNNRIHKEIGDITNNKWIMTSNYVYSRFLTKTLYPVYIEDRIGNNIIIGTKSSKLILNSKIKDNIVEIYTDFDSYKVIKLK